MIPVKPDSPVSGILVGTITRQAIKEITKGQMFTIESIADFDEQFFIHMRRALNLNDQANLLRWAAKKENESKAAIFEKIAGYFEQWAVDEFNHGLIHLQKFKVSK